MKLSFTTYRIFLKHTFGISRSSNNWYDIVLIFLRDGEIIGRGEAAPSLRYNESTKKILSILNRGVILPNDSSITLNDMLAHVYNQLDNVKSLQAAFSMAIWDWWSQKNNKSLFDLLGYKRKVLPRTSFTIAIGNINDIEEKIEEAKPYDILKVKLGTPNKDKEIFKEIRKYTDKMIRVDANEGWDYSTALDMCEWLSDKNVEFIEQPFSANMLDYSKELKKYSPLDIYADENSMMSMDIKK